MCQTQVGHTTKFWQKSEYVKCLSARFILKVYLDVAWLFLLILNVDMHMQNWCYRGEAECRVQSENVAPRIPLFLSQEIALPSKAFWWSRIKINVKIISVFWFTGSRVPCQLLLAVFCFVARYTHTHERRALFNTAPESAEQNKLNFGRWHKFVAKLSPTLNLFGFEREVLGGTGPLVWTQYLH